MNGNANKGIPFYRAIEQICTHSIVSYMIVFIRNPKRRQKNLTMIITSQGEGITVNNETFGDTQYCGQEFNYV